MQNCDQQKLEQLLIEKGFSHARAKSIAMGGWESDFRAERKECVPSMKCPDASLLGSDPSAETQITALVSELKQRRRRLQQKGLWQDVQKFLGMLPDWTNRVELFPGEKVDDISITPVSPGEVTFSVTPPRSMPDAKFECRVYYYRFEKDRLVRKELKLTDQRPSQKVDRGIQRSLWPGGRLPDAKEYFRRLFRNLTSGSTVASLKFYEFPDDHLKHNHRERGQFLIRARNHAVERFNRRRFLQQNPHIMDI